MGQLFKILKASACLLLLAGLTVQSANAQSAQYPPADEAWDGASYRALIQRVEDKGLALPTLSNAATKPVFERMVNADNIPLRMGLNRELAVTIRFQRLDSALDPIHKLAVLYSIETQKGKPYARELASLMVYESKVSAALLDLSEAYLATLTTDKRYEVHVAYLDQVKTGARQFYSGFVYGVTDNDRYSKADILTMIRGALAALPSYHAILTDQDRTDLTRKLTEQISGTTDQQVKTALTELRDTLQHRRIPT
ncbi:MAG TPA: hypothetical protein VEA77_06260 [Hyphomicrobium sp.]|nr:hypothetical protein [Hyphomicrobium sp.]